MANANVAFSKKTLQHFAKLVELTKQPSQELAERLLKKAIEREEEDFLLSVVANEYDVDGVKEIEDSEEIWK
ncbi:hypothetical protein [Wolbachia endosymbiont of Ctenocephalides felis wCfeJ]|uniref:hypothetical protein n=1 Tax=Wolbachia endosymbiont of Ctenocephalides felis wCfeJ TaxID=2732594 RepID=UPI001447CCA6|nr:hypothetical protein [Wolbachia endosymbiont of Ctenocephalides felis wCfeJ]WCR58267.1 MAG: hypothetical protein PG980_000739 [Wolbachia endosymbiont of Ctenocephalides felis wCfeJ]